MPVMVNLSGAQAGKGMGLRERTAVTFLNQLIVPYCVLNVQFVQLPPLMEDGS